MKAFQLSGNAGENIIELALGLGGNGGEIGVEPERVGGVTAIETC